jgi:diguanylate cyclase (GGDEF)-like protein
MSVPETEHRMLLLTDNTPLSASIDEFLPKHRFAMTVLAGGRRLVRELNDLMKKERFDIVIIDMVSLIYGGSDLVRRIRSADERAGIVLIAGHGSGTLAVEHFKDGADDFVTRPVNGDHMLMVLDRVIQKKSHMNADRDPYRNTPVVDGLTGLYNRSYFQERAIQEINASRRSKGGFSILLMEIGGLQEINSSFGRHAGDVVLKTVSARLQKQCRGCDTVARWGGDEFGVILRDASSVEARRVADRIMASVQSGEYGEIGDSPVSASIGISSYPGHAEEMKDLLSKADSALSRSRSYGGGGCSLYGNGECGNGAAV